MNSFSSTLVAAALGAGMLLGTAGLFLYHQFYASRRRLRMQEEISRLDITVAQLRAELEASRLRKSNSRRSSPSRSVRSFKSTRSGLASYYDSEDEEFYDISSGGEDDFETDIKKAQLDDSLQELFEIVDTLLKSGSAEDCNQASTLLKDYMNENGSNPGILWRLAKACHALSAASASAGNLDQRKELILEGLEWAKRSLELDSNEAEAHKWFAVLTGAYGDFLGMKEKIEGGYVFKKHVERAIDLRPEDASLRHLMGRFKYEVANLSWLERKAAGTLFAELPAATLPEATEDFLEAARLNTTPWKENSLYIAKCFLAQGKYSEGLKWLDDAAVTAINNAQDELAEIDVQKLLRTYASYRRN